MRFIQFGTLLSFLAVLSGCEGMPHSTINDVSKNFSDVIASSRDTLSFETKSKPSIRRDEAVMYYLEHPESPDGFPHRTKDEIDTSFARYVCAGAGALRKELAFLDYASAYATAAQGITKPGGDSFSEQWKKYQDNKKPLPNIQPTQEQQPKSALAVFNDCAEQVKKQLVFSGYPASDMSDEAAFALPAVISAFQALLKSLDQLATDGLRVANENESRAKLKAFVEKQHAHFDSVLSSDLSTGKLNDAWTRRKRHALWRPYMTFAKMLEDYRTADSIRQHRIEIMNLSGKLQQQLAEYDAIRSTQSPESIVTAIGNAEAQMYQAVSSNKVSLDAIVELLNGMRTDVEQLKADYKDLDSKTRTAFDTLR